MKQLLSKFRDPELGRGILERLKLRSGPRVTLMEVCGTHTMAISRMGIRELLADRLDLRSGPGCPVCVTGVEDIDSMLACARIPGVILATFGDMVRVPGSSTTLAEEKAGGADIRVVYSPQEAVALAGENLGKEIVFLGVGFETTAPAVALALEEAMQRGLKNFSVYSCHKLTPPAVRTLLESGDLRLHGFICPGHVSAVTGRQGWDFLGEEYGLPAVITGFESLDILKALETILDMVAAGEGKVQNGYTRVVREEGNPLARRKMDKYFQEVPAEWRGLGLIPASGLKLREEYARYDAEKRFPVEVVHASPPGGCACGEVLTGRITPPECALFALACTPRDPVGPCMVSSEGACAAYYKYHRGVPKKWDF